MALQVHRFSTVDAYLAMAGAYLAAQEAEHNLILGLCTSIRRFPESFADAPPTLHAVTTDGERVVGAALRTPPDNQILSEADDPAVAAALADALAAERLPGVIGPKMVVARFAERWAAVNGRRARHALSERIFQLDRVIPPRRPASGTWRTASPADRQLVAEWLLAFLTEALPSNPQPDDPLEVADRWIQGTSRTLYLWEDEGAAVSVAGAAGATPNGLRIGGGYAPPKLRRRGYATSLTAAVSRDQLDRGRRFCFLFTDLANPTSNRIYQEIGYRPVTGVDLYPFHAHA
jgi:predicted GNAT family acetyltransferase